MMNNQITGKGETYVLLVDGSTAAYIVDEWVVQNYDFDLRIRRPKDREKYRGKVVIELDYALFASKLVEMYGAEVAVKKQSL